MADLQVKFGSKEYLEIMNLIFGDVNHQIYDAMNTNGFYGVISKKGVSFLGDKLRLTPNSHVLDIGSGIGGPALFLAKKYRCKVTGIDISEYNYHASVDNTKKAKLEHLVDFVHGNGLELPFPDKSFTHVIGCDALCYFPDKIQLYTTIYRVLDPEGILGFLEAAHETPKHYHFEKLSGPSYFESIDGYISKLKSAGFDEIQHYDVSDLSCEDNVDGIFNLITKRDEIKKTLGSSVYYKTLEYKAETLALISKRALTHCCFIARKK